MKRMKKVEQCLIHGGKQFRRVCCEEAWISGTWIEHAGRFYVPTINGLKENKPYQEALNNYVLGEMLDGYYSMRRIDKEWTMEPE
jgi:hypothetical protein